MILIMLYEQLYNSIIGGNKTIRRVKLALVILAHDVWNNRMGKNPMMINNQEVIYI